MNIPFCITGFAMLLEKYYAPLETGSLLNTLYNKSPLLCAEFCQYKTECNAFNYYVKYIEDWSEIEFAQGRCEILHIDYDKVGDVIKNVRNNLSSTFYIASREISPRDAGPYPHCVGNLFYLYTQFIIGLFGIIFVFMLIITCCTSFLNKRRFNK
jgi:hypothetical protein